ncbi:DUF5011 domain-containing protein, partial [Verrucomicrobia bacterium]|nr:DUF5011 domain-containing protein [Verrucomicrobiota bacterium]
ATASDIVDGDLSSEIKVTVNVDTQTPGDIYYVNYEVTDTDGNASNRTLSVKVVDSLPPQITLTGEAVVTIDLGSWYKEPGFIAVDAVDGQVGVSVQSDFVPTRYGQYTVTYRSVDGAGNVSTVNRYIHTYVEAGGDYIGMDLFGADLSDADLKDTKFLGSYLSGADLSGSDLRESKLAYASLSGADLTNANLRQADLTGAKLTKANLNGANLEGAQLDMAIGSGIQGIPLTMPTGYELINGEIVALDLTSPVIALAELSPYVVEVGSTFVAPEASASDIVDGDLSSEIKVTVNVNTQVLGDTHQVNYEVTDTAGNTASSTLMVSVVEPVVINLSGTISARKGNNLKPVNNVSVFLNYNGITIESKSDNKGQYIFGITPDLGPAVVRAVKFDGSKAIRGVDVGDIIALRNHIINRTKLPGLLEMLSADANRDGSIDVTDIVAMRKVILNKTDYFSTDSEGKPYPVWRFISSSYLNRTIEEAFAEVLSTEFINYDNPMVDIDDADFIGIKLGDANLDWEELGGATAQSLPYQERIAGILSLSKVKQLGDNKVLFEVTSDAYQGLLGAQFGVKWDERILTLSSISAPQVPAFKHFNHLSVEQGFAMIAWDDASLRGIDINSTAPIMNLVFDVNPQADRGTSIQLIEPLMVWSEGRKRAVMGVASYYHPEGAQVVRGQGLIRSINRMAGKLSLEFATQDELSYVVESNQNLASGRWEAITTVEGSGRHEVIEIPTTDQVQSYLRVREMAEFVK